MVGHGGGVVVHYGFLIFMGHSKDKWATVAKMTTHLFLVPHGLNFLSKGQQILQLFSELATIYSKT